MKINYDQLKKYKESFKKLGKTCDDFLKDFLIEMAERVIAKTKPRTPVDTGALRNAWQLGDVKGNGADIYIEILNPMEYATEIEYGHRIVSNGIEIGWFEGRFMLKTSIDEVKRQMPARYAQKFSALCKELGIDNN